MFRRFFKRRSAKAAAKRAAKQEAAARKKQAIFRPVAQDRGIIAAASTEESEYSPLVSATSSLASGSYTYDKPLLESLTEFHDMKLQLEKVKVELEELEESVEIKDAIIAEQKDKVANLQAELCITEEKLDATKLTLTMKQLELKARQQDVLDKDAALLQAKNKENNAIDNLVGLGLNIVGHFPFLKI